MTNLEIQSEIIEILLKHRLTLKEMKNLIFSVEGALEKIVIPSEPTFKNDDGTITDMPKDVRTS